MENAGKTHLLRTKTPFIVIALITATLGTSFFRNHHILFDAHHRYPVEETTITQWFAGWFRDWDQGPLSIAIVDGPKAYRNGQILDKACLWYLRHQDPGAAMIFNKEMGAKRNLIMIELPKTNEFRLIGDDIEWITFKASNEKFYSGNLERNSDQYQYETTWLTLWLPWKGSITKQNGNSIDSGFPIETNSDELKQRVYLIGCDSRDMRHHWELSFDRKMDSWQIHPNPQISAAEFASLNSARP